MTKSPYKIVEELEKKIETNYSMSILTMSKELLVEIDKEVKSKKEK